MGSFALFNNFTGGEISPTLWSRTDLEKYGSSCRYLQNMIPLPQGGVRRRPGSIWVAAAKSQTARLIPFRYSVSTNFVLELGYYSGASYLRFFSNHAQVLLSGSPYEIVAPYSSIAEIRTIQFRQINDIMYLVCPTKPVYKLSRVTDTSWTLAEVSWDWPAMRDENATSTTLTVSAATVGTGRTLTASASLFDATHVGAYFQLSHLREASSEELAIGITTGVATSSAITVKGPWSLTTTERWYGELQLQRSYDGSTWEVIRRFKSAADRNVNATGNEELECQLRLYFVSAGDPYGSGVWTGTPPADYVKAKAKIESEAAYVDGLVKITAYTSATVVTATVVVACSSTNATKLWREGAWSAYRGYPRSVGFFEQSLAFGGTASQPNYIWKSKIGDFENFFPGDADDDSVTYQAASVEQNPINWLDGQQRLLVGTANQELAFFSSNDEPLTPTNVSVRTQSNYGSAHKQAVPINDVLIFLERASNHLREMSFDVARDGYLSPDLCLLAEHLFSGVTIYDVSVARLPEPAILVTCSDLTMRVLTYNREQNILAWSRWSLGFWGISSVATISGATTDEVWFLAPTSMGGCDIAYFAPSRSADTGIATDVLADLCTVDTTPGSAPYTVSVAHLIGYEVDICADGVYLRTEIVGLSGTVDVGRSWSSQAVVGLPYTALVSPVTVDAGYADGPTNNRPRRVSKLRAQFRGTNFCKYGVSASATDTVDFSAINQTPGTDISPWTGTKELYLPQGTSTDAPFYLIADRASPFTLISINAKWEAS